MKSFAGKILSFNLLRWQVFAQVAKLYSPVFMSINALKWPNRQRLENNCTEIEMGQNKWFKKNRFLLLIVGDVILSKNWPNSVYHFC